MSCALGAALALAPLPGYSLGLGKLQMKSALNQPLNAEIDITSISESELKGLNVSLASRADFDAAGAERLPMLSQIKFIVAKRPNGRYYLHLQTEAPIDEPFLHLLLQIEWPGGRLVREYTALIDPPSYVAAKSATVNAPQTVAPAPAPMEVAPKPAETVPPPSPPASGAGVELGTAAVPPPSESQPLTASAQEPSREEMELAAPEAPKPEEKVVAAPSEMVDSGTKMEQPASGWAGETTYKVQRGDTLWRIAERIRGDRQLSLEQVMLAIFKNNPDAFFRSNVNNLYAGKVLTMPEREAVEAMSARDARREFRAQYDAWQEYKIKLAAANNTLKVAETEPESSEPSPAGETKAADTKPKAEMQKEATAAEGGAGKSGDGDLLKIVRGAKETKENVGGDKAGDSGSTEAPEQTALADRASTLEESLQSKQLETRELAEKVGQVRSQIKNEKRLIELENQALAEKTAKPAEMKPTETAPEKPKAEEASAPTPPKAEEKVATPQPPAKPKVATAPTPPVKKPVRRPPPPPPPPQADEGFLASLLATVMATVSEGSVLPLVGGIAVLAGGAILMMYMRRRRRSIAEFEESILASDAIATDAVPTGETTGQVSTGDTSFLSDFSKGGMGQVHTDEVDPVAEAEVYLAYGRDETAEEILKEAIVKNPERHELKQKLLEIYHQRSDVNAFETLAEELYAALGGRGGTIWQKVEEMGRKLNPNNPMFRGGAPGSGATEPAGGSMSVPTAGVEDRPDEISMDVDMGGIGTGTAPAATQVMDQSAGLDFNLDMSSSEEPAADSSNSLDFELNTDFASDQSDAVSLDSGSDSGAGEGEFESLELGAPSDESVIDFDGGQGGISETAASDDTGAALGGASDDNEIKWDMEAPAIASPDVSEASPPAEGGNGAAESSEAGGQWDETATKLDLAKAYIDMGDSEGARSILDEVLAEGNEQQKQQAAELAAQIA